MNVSPVHVRLYLKPLTTNNKAKQIRKMQAANSNAATKFKTTHEARGTMAILFQLILQTNEKQLIVNIKDIELLRSTLKNLWKTLLRKELMETFSACILGVSRKKTCCFLPPYSFFHFLEIMISSLLFLHNKCAHMCSPPISKACGVR